MITSKDLLIKSLENSIVELKYENIPSTHIFETFYLVYQVNKINMRLNLLAINACNNIRSHKKGGTPYTDPGQDK